MLKYYLDISVDDDFGVNSNSWMGGNTIVNPDFIKSINGSKAIIDPNLFIGRNFFKPLEKLLENDVPLSKLSHDDFVKVVSNFGKCKVTKNKKRTIIDFSSDNHFDLNYAYIENSDQVRISFDYKNSPVNSFYLLEEDSGVVKVMVSPFTKNYYVLDQTEWWYFVNYLTEKVSIAETRDFRINQVLSDKPDKSVNLIRQLKFYVKKNSNSFLYDVLSFYNKRGYLTDRQFAAVAKTIGWRLLDL